MLIRLLPMTLGSLTRCLGSYARHRRRRQHVCRQHCRFDAEPAQAAASLTAPSRMPVIILLGLVAGNDTGSRASIVYLMVYAVMDVRRVHGSHLAERAAVSPAKTLADLRGLSKTHPVHAALFVILLLSLAGIPPTAGFIGKYYIFLALIETGHYALAAIAVRVRRCQPLYLFPARARNVSADAETREPLAASFGIQFALVRHGRAHRYSSASSPSPSSPRIPHRRSRAMNRRSAASSAIRGLRRLSPRSSSSPSCRSSSATCRWSSAKFWPIFKSRLGPMRVGPHGLLQPLADGLKLLLKEDIVPTGARQAALLVCASVLRSPPRSSASPCCLSRAAFSSPT